MILTIVGIVLFALGILASIALHEVGHLVPAKRGGVKVTQYMVGFGPTIWSRRRGETEYGVKAIPLGGYIRMIGMFPPAKDGSMRSSSTGAFRQLVDDARQVSAAEIGPGDEDRVFYKKSVRRKVLIMLGGPSMNAVIAVVLLTITLTTIGLSATSTETFIGGVNRCLLPADSTRTSCADSDAAAPARAAGLRPGDKVLSVDGQPVADWNAMQTRIRAAGGRPIAMTVERDGGNQDLTITPSMLPVIDEAAPGGIRSVGVIGITPRQYLERQTLTAVPAYIGDLAQHAVVSIVAVPKRMVGVWQAAFGGGNRDPEGPVGVVGVARLGGEIVGDKELTAESKVGSFLSLLAALNLALFVFNLIPLLPLDGGHVAGALWEGLRRQIAKVRKRPDPGYVDVARMLPIAYTVAIALIGMSALLLYADIVNPIKLRG